jgi:hypothetical protein
VVVVVLAAAVAVRVVLVIRRRSKTRWNMCNYDMSCRRSVVSGLRYASLCADGHLPKAKIVQHLLVHYCDRVGGYYYELCWWGGYFPV